MHQTIQTNQSLDKTSLLQHVNSTDMSQDLDPSHFYLANDPRHHQQMQMRPLFPRQHSFPATQTTQLAPSRSVEMLPSSDDAQKPEKQYHYLPGNGPESPRSITMPNLLDQSQGQSNTLPPALYPPFPPQPHPRTFTPIGNKSHDLGLEPAPLGHTLLPFANSSNIVPGFIREPFHKKDQSFDDFLEEKQYETLEEKSKLDGGPPSLVNFPPSKPKAADDKIMNIGDDDTIVRHITVSKKEKTYPINCLFILYQIFLIILLLSVAAVAVVALLEVKRLEGSSAAGVTTLATAPPTATVPTNRTTQQITELEARISEMNATLMELQAEISLLTSQLTASNTLLSERVIGVEESGTQLNSQLQSLNFSLAQSANDIIGPCIHTQFSCGASAGGLGCIPNNPNRPELIIRDGYQLSSVWCEGSVNETEINIDNLSDMNTYVKFFDDNTPQAYQCGCNLPLPLGFVGALIFRCTTNIIQCRF